MTGNTTIKKMPIKRIPAADYRCEIVRIIDETPYTKRYFFRIKDCKQFDFLPGQFANLEFPIHHLPKRRLRSYSIASPPTGEPLFELVIVLKPGGAGTTWLFNEAKVGTQLPLKAPYGKFCLPEVLDKEICFICTGTGIAPFRSMIHYIRVHQIPHPPITLIFGTRKESDILYYEEMLELDKSMDNFRYIPVLSQAKDEADWQGKSGYVHPVYMTLFSDRRTADFYICGWQAMIADARNHLTEMGYQKQDIHFESYG